MAFSPIELNPASARPEERAVARKEQENQVEEKEGTLISASDPDAVAAAVASNRAITLDDRSIEFSYDEELHRVIVKVKSRDTEEVVRQIPPKEYVQFLARFKEAVGVLFDEVA